MLPLCGGLGQALHSRVWSFADSTKVGELTLAPISAGKRALHAIEVLTNALLACWVEAGIGSLV